MERSHPLGYITKHSVRVCLETVSRTVFSSLKQKKKICKTRVTKKKLLYIFYHENKAFKKNISFNYFHLFLIIVLQNNYIIK